MSVQPLSRKEVGSSLVLARPTCKVTTAEVVRTTLRWGMYGLFFLALHSGHLLILVIDLEAVHAFV